MSVPHHSAPLPASRLQIFWRGCRGRCPRCASPAIFRSTYRLEARCPHCGLPLELEDGWSYGSVPLAYALACLVWVLPVTLAFFFGWLHFAAAALVGVLGVIVLPIVTFRFTKKMWIGLYYAILPHELTYRTPGQRGDAH